MKKLKNMVAVIVCLSVILTVPAHAQLTSTEHGWLESIKNSTVELETYVSDIRAMFSSTQLARNPIAYYTNAVYTQLQNFQSMFKVNGRVDNYLWEFRTYLNNLSNAFDFSGKIYTSFPDYFEAFDEAVYQIQTNTRRIYNNLDPFYNIGETGPTVYKILYDSLNLGNTFLESFDSAFDAETHGTSKDIYSMLYEAYEDTILPADETDKTIYELLYDMHTELGGYEEGNYGFTLYGTLNEQLNLLKLREPIWEYELEEFNKNKFTHEFIGDNFTSGTDSETSLGMHSIMSMYELLHDVNTDLQDAGRQSDFLDEMNRVNNEGSGWFSSDTQNALDSVPQAMLFSDDADPYNMNDYYEQWEVLSDVVH